MRGLVPRAMLLGLGIGVPVADRSPRDVVLHALRAVEGDSVTVVAQRWRAAIEQHPNDRLAALGLATLARLTYQYADADRQLAALLPGAAATTDSTAGPARGAAAVGRPRLDAVAVYAQLGLAWALDARGLAARADSAFVRARAMARAHRDPGLQGEALIGLSVNRASQQGIPVGVALLDTAAHLVGADAPDLRADVAVRRALFSILLSRRSGAADALAAAALARRAQAPRLEARALRALALGFELSNRFDSAGIVLAAVERIERAVHDRATLAETLMRHADVYHNRGDIGPYKQFALAAQSEALESHNLFALASSNVGLGSVSLLLNDEVSAGRYLRQAAAQYDSMQDRSGFALVQTYEADLAVSVGQWSVARDLAAQVRDFDHLVGDPAEFEEWRDLIEINIRAGDLAAAEAAMAGAEGLARERHQPRWYSSLDIDRGRLALAEGRPNAAAAALTRYLQSLDSGEHVARYTSRALLAEAQAREGLLDRAELELTAGADELDAWRTTVTDHELRPYIFQASASEVNDRDASTATVLAALATGGRAPVAFALAERRRARDLADRLVRLAALREDPADTGSNPRSMPPGSLTSEGDVAVRAAAERGAADSVAAAMPDRHTALLEFVSGAHGAPTTLFTITRSPSLSGPTASTAVLRAYILPSADTLAPRIARFVALLENGDDAVALGASLAAATIDSALQVLGPAITHVIIVPDGPLHRVPFDALRTPDSLPLVTRYAVSIAPSAAALRALWRRPSSAGGDRRVVRLLALADPVFSGAEPTSGPDGTRSDTYRDAFDSAGGLPRLAQSGREAQLVARYAPFADVRLRRAATAAFFLHAPLEPYRVIHIATHALVDERSIARTALALTPGDGEGEFVTPSELGGLHLRADLVVLSACRTAGGVVIDGDGVQGLTGPLLAAGARSVVATQWRIGDRAILPLVDAFYAGLARGLTVADALQAAKRGAIARHAPVAEWATFTVIGDPLVRVGLRPIRLSPMVLLAWIAIPVGAVAAVLGLWEWGRRRTVKTEAILTGTEKTGQY